MEINLFFIIVIQDGFKYLDIILFWVKFEEICFDLIDCCGIFVENVIWDVKIDKFVLDEIVFVGGFIWIFVV